jgi:hypothetical protein
MRRQRLRLQDRNRNSRQTNSNTGNDSCYEHLPVIKGRGLYRSTNDDNDVGQYDRSLPSNLLAKDESNDGTDRTTYIINCSDQASHCRIGPAESILEAFATKDTAEETLVIWLIVRWCSNTKNGVDSHPNKRKSKPEVMRMIAMRLLPLSSRNSMMKCCDVQYNE